MLNTNQLDSLVSASDANTPDADLAASLSTPTYTPRSARVTFATLCAADVWGFAKAAGFMAALSASTNPVAKAAISLLNGSGFDATDPQAAGIAAGMVALSGSTIDGDDAKIAVGTKSFPAGDVVAASDIAASRKRLAFVAAMALASAQYNAAVKFIADAQMAGTTAVPDQAAVLSKLGTLAS